MIQDYSLTVTPAVARQLVLVNKYKNMELDPKIFEIAKQDQVGEEAFDKLMFPMTHYRKVVTQFILDRNFRVGLIGKDMRKIVLNTIKFANISPIIIRTSNHYHEWQTLLKQWNLSEAIVGNSKTIFDSIDDQKRQGILINDDQEFFFGNASSNNVMAEFSKTVMLFETESIEYLDTETHHMASRLFPDHYYKMYNRYTRNRTSRQTILFNVFIPEYQHF